MFFNLDLYQCSICLYTHTDHPFFFPLKVVCIKWSRTYMFNVTADTYLLGTVMLVFGMGLYELFISNLDIAKTHKLSHPAETSSYRSNLFGMFALMVCSNLLLTCWISILSRFQLFFFFFFFLQERPKWLEIQSINELKTKVGHVIVMILLVGLLEKSKKVVICSSADLFCFAAAVLLSSGGLYLLSKLNNVKQNKQA